MKISESRVINKYKERLKPSHVKCPICMNPKMDYIDPKTERIDIRYSPILCQCEDHLKMLRDTEKINTEIYSRWFDGTGRPVNYHEEKHRDFIIAIRSEIIRLERIVWENQQGEKI